MGDYVYVVLGSSRGGGERLLGIYSSIQEAKFAAESEAEPTFPTYVKRVPLGAKMHVEDKEIGTIGDETIWESNPE